MNLRAILVIALCCSCFYVGLAKRSGGSRGGSKGGSKGGGSKGGGLFGGLFGGGRPKPTSRPRPTYRPVTITYRPVTITHRPVTITHRPVPTTRYTRPTIRTTTRPRVQPTLKTTPRPLTTKRYPTVNIKPTSTPRPIGWNVEKSQAHIIKHPNTHVLGAPPIPPTLNGGKIGGQNGGKFGGQNGGHFGGQNGGHGIENQIKYRPLGQSINNPTTPRPSINYYTHPPVHAPIGHPYQPGQVIVVPAQQRNPGFSDYLVESLVWNSLNSGYRHHHHYHHHHHHSTSSTNPNPGSTNVENHTTIINNHYGQNQTNQNNTTTTETPTSTVPPFQYYISNEELMNFTEILFAKEELNLKRYITLNLQNKTKSGNLTDEAPRPLLYVSPEINSLPTVGALKSLYEQYQIDSSLKEISTANTKRQESLLIETFMNTDIMTAAMTWLASKYYIEYDDLVMREALRQMWFNKIEGSTSGFERIFLAEIYPGENLLGAQNWIYFNDKERKGEIDYFGYSEEKNIAEKAWLLKLNLKMGQSAKLNATMLIGTSPELEMALYTICFYVRPNDICHISLGGNKFFIYTHTFRHFGKDLIDMGIIAF